MCILNIDIIILSYAKDDKLKDLTLHTVDTLLKSEDSRTIRFEVLVIESNKNLMPYEYPGTKTMYPETDFGFNKYMNIGIKATTSEFVCLCNNDLIFHKGWATEILKAFKQYKVLESANPYCPNFDYNKRIQDGINVIRRDKTLDINGVLTGWCIFVKRSIFKKIGFLDEQFTFWYADNDYDLTLRKYGIKHALVKSSLVTHVACQSHDLLSDKKEELTIGQRAIFEKKWQKRNILRKVLSIFKLTFLN